MAPRVSVIITAYNVAEYIERTVASALAQTENNIEVIVVDDASTDRTLPLARAIADTRVRVIALNENYGPSGARNMALEQAQGEWVAILDGDDGYTPERLSALLALAETKEATIVCDNLLCVGEDRQWPMFNAAQLERHSPLTAEEFIAGNSNFLSGFGLGYLKPVVRTDFLRKHGLRYDESIRIGEDYLFLLEALLCGAKCVLHPEPLYHYRRRSGSISHRLTKEAVARIMAQDEALLARYTLRHEATRAQARRTRNLHEAYHYNALVHALKMRQWAEALKLLVKHPAAARHLAQPIKKRLI